MWIGVMSKFFLTVNHPDNWPDRWSENLSDFKVNPDSLVLDLKRNWPEFEVVISSNENEASKLVYWEQMDNDENSYFEGNLLSDYQTIVLSSGPRRLFVEFVIWWRRYVPDKYEIWLYEEDRDEVLSIVPTITETDIVSYSGFL
jgi:hypothetical protein